MAMTIDRQVAVLSRLTVAELRRRYTEAFDEPASGNNKTWLIRRIAWRLQARVEGGLTERALRRARELADDADLRMTPPVERGPMPASADPVMEDLPTVLDDRLPPPGTILTRPYKGDIVQVLVLPRGFEYAGTVYGSLSGVAKAVTGSHCNGFLFFRLTGKERR